MSDQERLDHNPEFHVGQRRFVVERKDPNNKSHRRIEGEWYFPVGEEIPQIPPDVVSEACMHAAHMPTIKIVPESELPESKRDGQLLTKKDLAWKLQRHGADEQTAKRMTDHLNKGSKVSVVGFYINGAYLAIVAKHDGPPEHTTPYRVKLTKTHPVQK